MRLTKPNVARLVIPAGKSELLVFDDALPGFGVRLRLGGKRTWVCQYRIGGKQRRVSIGTLDVIEADEARKRAKDVLAKVHLGADPQVEKHTNRAKAVRTLAAAAAEYLAGHAERNLRPKTVTELTRSFKQHWAPLAEVPVHSLSRAAISDRLEGISKESGPYAANRSKAYLSALLNWAVMRGWTEDNPAAKLGNVIEETSRDRVLTADELRLVWQASGTGQYGAIVRLLLLTGQRREEVGGMLWSELDFGKGLWSLQPDRTKNRLPHDVPLSAAAADIIASQPRTAGRDHVFGSRTGPFSGWSKAKAALDHRITAARADEGGKVRPAAPWRLHDLRRTAATGMAELGVQPHVLEAVLNHISGHKAGVAGIYNRAAYAAEKRAALALWASQVTGTRHGP